MKRPTARDDSSFAHSMTDLMAGVAGIFLLIAAIFMIQAMASREHERKAAKKNEDKLRKIQGEDLEARRFLKDLEQDFLANDQFKGVLDVKYDPKQDPYMIELTLNRNRFRFGSRECSLTSEMRAAIVGPIREAAGKICNWNGAATRLSAITMEGHTDNQPFLAADEKCGAVPTTCTAGDAGDCQRAGFENNVRLSGARANNVFFELRSSVDRDSNLAACLDNFFVVAGRGPIEAKGTTPEDRDRDRRVVIKVRVHTGASQL